MNDVNMHYGCLSAEELENWNALFESGRLLNLQSVPSGRESPFASNQPSEPTALLANMLIHAVVGLFCAYDPLSQHFDVGVHIPEPEDTEGVQLILRWIGGPAVQDIVNAVEMYFDDAPFRAMIHAARAASDDELECLKSAVWSSWRIAPPAMASEASGGGEVWPPNSWSLAPTGPRSIEQLCIEWIDQNVHPLSGLLAGPATTFIAPPYIGPEHTRCSPRDGLFTRT